ncbi:MAG: hypothetical protein O3A53_01055 [Acidobacteria bacterium]|nr:hypothetical protein [Acidobacteriota bacterium]
MKHSLSKVAQELLTPAVDGHRAQMRPFSESAIRVVGPPIRMSRGRSTRSIRPGIDIAECALGVRDFQLAFQGDRVRDAEDDDPRTIGFNRYA